jgi:ubiquinone/menaquinone biosynthesis C-methylase UbiE
MTATHAPGRSPHEARRLRAQSRLWGQSTGRLLDRVGLAPGMRCLDAGCGSGETMRLLAQRVGPSGRVTGLDVDGVLGRGAIVALHAAGHCQCDFVEADLLVDDPFPELRFDLVYARLLLLQIGDPVAAVRRLWGWVTPGGHLALQEYELSTIASDPQVPFVDELRLVVTRTLAATGCDLHLGRRLPGILAAAGVGQPVGTDVGGRLEPLAAAKPELEALYRTVLPAALELGITTEAESAAWLEEVARPALADHHALWPLLVGVHVRKPTTEGESR